MNYSEPLPQQLFDFLFFFGFGFLDGLLFRLIEFFRKLFGNGKYALLVQDLLFSVLSTVLMFVFLLVYADGAVRINLVAAAVLGACVFFLTAGKPVKKILDIFASVIRKGTAVLVLPFTAISKKLCIVFSRATEKTMAFKNKKKPEKKKSEKKRKNLKKKSKKDLKNSVKSV